MIRHLLSAIDTLNNWVGVIVSFVVLFMIGLTAFEVISRFAFNAPTNWVQETTMLIFGFYIIIGGGYVLLKRAHIKVDILWSRLSLRGRAIADLATCGFSFLFLGVILWFSSRIAWLSTLMLEHSVTPFAPPIYPIKICLVIGALLLLLQLIAKTIRDVHLAIGGVEGV